MKRKGFTLIEVIIAVAITGIVASAAYLIWSNMTRTYNRQQKLTDAQAAARKAVNMIINDMKRNDTINVTAGAVQQNIEAPPIGGTTWSAITIGAITGVAYHFDNVDHSIKRQNISGGAIVAGSDFTVVKDVVEDFSISQPTAGFINVSIGIKVGEGSNAVTRDIQASYVQRSSNNSKD